MCQILIILPKQKKKKLPLPKIDPELPTQKSNDVTDLSSSLGPNVHLPSTTAISGVSVVKARDPRLTRDPRLASRDPRNQLLNRRVVINEANLATPLTSAADKTSLFNSKLESTPKTTTISPSLLSNMRSLDAVKSYSNTQLVTNLAKK